MAVAWDGTVTVTTNGKTGTGEISAAGSLDVSQRRPRSPPPVQIWHLTGMMIRIAPDDADHIRGQLSDGIVVLARH